MLRKSLVGCLGLMSLGAMPTASAQAPEITVALPGGETMEMVWIPAGTFLMGAALGQPDTRFREHPQHEVTISRGFYLGKYEVTQAQWTAVMGTQPWHARPVVIDCPQCAAVMISWDDTQAFIHQLNVATADSLYRLPTEAEWEHAARAGTTTPWFFGTELTDICDYAWVHSNNCGDFFDNTCTLPDDAQCGNHEVGLKPPNPWGLYDIYGGVQEWVQDWWIRWYTEEPQVDPLQTEYVETDEPRGFEVRMIRGGYYNLPASAISSSSRRAAEDEGNPGNIQTGFRLVRQEQTATLTLPSGWGQIKAQQK